MQWTQLPKRLSKLSVSGIKLSTYGLALVATLAGYGWLKSYLEGPDLQVATIYKFKPKPVVVVETRFSEKIRTVVKEVKVEVKEPTPKQQEKLEQKYGLSLDGKDLLGEWQIPKTPYGGDAIIAVGPTGRVEVVVKPKAKPFFELGGRRELGLGLGQTSLGASWKVYYEQDLARVGPVQFSGEAAFGDRGDGRAQWSAMVKAGVRF